MRGVRSSCWWKREKGTRSETGVKWEGVRHWSQADRWSDGQTEQLRAEKQVKRFSSSWRHQRSFTLKASPLPGTAPDTLRPESLQPKQQQIKHLQPDSDSHQPRTSWGSGGRPGRESNLNSRGNNPGWEGEAQLIYNEALKIIKLTELRNMVCNGDGTELSGACKTCS